MKIPCFRCGGDGFLPQFSHIKGGVCFTCGGDGEVNTFSSIKLNKMTFSSEINDYVSHSMNRDLGELLTSGEVNKLKPKQKATVIAEVKERGKRYHHMKVNEAIYADTKELGKEFIRNLDEVEELIPDTYKDSPHYKAGKVSLVPVHWLKKFQGNALRRSPKEMREFAETLLDEGLKDPVMIIIGQEDRHVSIGEGNHRTFAHMEAGLDFVPARVARQRFNKDGGDKNVRGSYYYDKMSRVPKNDYFKADASPEEVFDTFYDHGDLPEEPKPGKLDGKKEISNLYFDDYDVQATIEEETGVDASDINLKEYGIRNLYTDEGNSRDVVDYLKSLIKILEDNGDNVMEFLELEDILEFAEDAEKMGSYIVQYESMLIALSSLSSRKRKANDKAFDDLMSLLD